MEILIGKGISILKFGADESQVIATLGQPDKIYEMEGSKRLQFFELQIEVAIEPEHENRFGWVEVKNSESTLYGQKFIGQRVKTVLAAISAAISEVPKHEDYGGTETYFYENNWLELQFELDRLRSINLGVLFKDDDTVIWP